jgi:hypothetical protein
MQSNENHKGSLYKADVLKYVGQVLIRSGGNQDLVRAGGMSKYVGQCLYRGCETYWFAGGEHKVSQEIPTDSFRELKRAIIILNEIESVIPDDIIAVKGLGDVSHDLCRLCQREMRQDDYRRQQKKKGFPDCFGKAGAYCDREECAEGPDKNCAHPCTIHPEREAIRRKRMELLKNHLRGDKK